MTRSVGMFMLPCCDELIEPEPEVPDPVPVPEPVAEPVEPEPVVPEPVEPEPVPVAEPVPVVEPVPVALVPPPDPERLLAWRVPVISTRLLAYCCRFVWPVAIRR